jgi:hypothetical protein
MLNLAQQDPVVLVRLFLLLLAARKDSADATRALPRSSRESKFRFKNVRPT